MKLNMLRRTSANLEKAQRYEKKARGALRFLVPLVQFLFRESAGNLDRIFAEDVDTWRSKLYPSIGSDQKPLTGFSFTLESRQPLL